MNIRTLNSYHARARALAFLAERVERDWQYLLASGEHTFLDVRARHTWELKTSFPERLNATFPRRAKYRNREIRSLSIFYDIASFRAIR